MINTLHPVSFCDFLTDPSDGAMSHREGELPYHFSNHECAFGLFWVSTSRNIGGGGVYTVHMIVLLGPSDTKMLVCCWTPFVVRITKYVYSTLYATSEDDRT